MNKKDLSLGGCCFPKYLPALNGTESKDWDDIKELLDGYDKSMWARVPVSEDSDEYYKTEDVIRNGIYDIHSDDTAITTIIHKEIVRIIENKKDCQLYVRAFPEITIVNRFTVEDNGFVDLRKQVYLRLQYVDKKTIIREGNKLCHTS